MIAQQVDVDNLAVIGNGCHIYTLTSVCSIALYTYGVIRASPVGHRMPGLTSATSLHAFNKSLPAALCIAENH